MDMRRHKYKWYSVISFALSTDDNILLKAIVFTIQWVGGDWKIPGCSMERGAVENGFCTRFIRGDDSDFEGQLLPYPISSFSSFPSDARLGCPSAL